MARCLVTRKLVGPALEELHARHEVTTWPGDLPPAAEQLRAAVSDVEGLLCLLTDMIDAALLAVAPHLRVISNYAVGTDNVDLEACRARGIPVGRTPDVLTDATADLAFALILASVRRLPEAAAAVAAGEWRTWEPARWLGMELAGKRLLVVGPGRIGQAVARRAAGFGMTVDTARRGDDLHAKLAAADVVTLHCPLTPQTHHLIDTSALAAMKPTAHLVNTARGPIVDQAGLRAALEAGTIAGAALDVTDPEPPPPGDPLLGAPNLIVLPHVGSATHESRARMTEIAVANLLAGLDGEPLPHPAA